ncbi:WD40 repeat domain-containing protein [Streptomyces microflavus]|uniref:WD40 repeat domain-containing protein n=1 Tax=Streptomyces microflavus TaxID=1919 RepID=UPI00192BEE0F|nr:WD40 repeat domain-containing protein [Streptomyces microflavus]QQZ58023.1 WD40 repeat domain-containing protein [Streptomyces microflavus]
MTYQFAGSGDTPAQQEEAERRAAAAELRTIRAQQGSPTLAQIVARAPRGTLGATAVGAVLRGDTLPGCDYYMAIVRVLLAYGSGKVVSHQDKRVSEWRQRWTRLKHLKEEAKLRRAAGKSRGTTRPQGLGRLATRVLETAVGRGEYVQLSPMASGTGGVWAVAFSPDGTLMATGHGAKTTQLWDTVTQERAGTPLFGHTDCVISTAFSPDGRYLVTSSQDKTARLWDIATRTLIAEPLEGHTDPVHAALFSPDGDLLITASRTLRLWNVSNPAQPFKVGKPFAGSHTSKPAFSVKGLLATGHQGGIVHLWEVTNQQRVSDPLRGHAGDVTAVAFSREGRLLATGGLDVQLWDVDSRQMVNEPLECDREPVVSIAFSPDGQTLAAVTGAQNGNSSSDHVVRLWNTSDWRPIGPPLTGHKGVVEAAAFSPDSRLYATGGYDGQLRLRILPAASGG